MRLSRKKLADIQLASTVLDTFREVEPKQAGNTPWWESHPEMWYDFQRELWDLVSRNEDLLKAEIIKILTS